MSHALLTLAGAAAPPWRYLRIDIECRQSRDAQIATLGHELQHAVEVAMPRARPGTRCAGTSRRVPSRAPAVDRRAGQSV